MKREVIRVEPLSSYLEKWKAPVSAVTRGGGMVYVSGLPPFDPETGEMKPLPIEWQAERVMAQMKQCLEAAGASLDNVVKCNIFCTSSKHFQAVNAVYETFFEAPYPARATLQVAALPRGGRVEIDAVVALKA